MKQRIWFKHLNLSLEKNIPKKSKNIVFSVMLGKFAPDFWLFDSGKDFEEVESNQNPVKPRFIQFFTFFGVFFWRFRPHFENFCLFKKNGKICVL